jgi:maltose alpha-D-glucosyltransferase/alpha-amylase
VSARLPTPEAIAEWLPGQRWFGAKTRRILRVTFADALAVGPGVLLLVDVELSQGGHERYAAPVRGGEAIVDALGDVEFCRALLALLAGAGSVAGQHGALHGVPAAGLAERWPQGPPPDVTSRRIGGEQSNSSLVLGDAFVLKHFRKLADGVNPEAEISRFLTERTSFRNTPRLAGHLEYRDRRGGSTTLAVMQTLVPDGADGWQWILGRMREPRGADATVQALRQLGRRTGELHRALASDRRDADFAPETITADDVAAWADAVVDQLAAARAALPAGSITIDHGAVRAALAPLIGRQKIRHHGDFHLGQTLYRPAADDWMIIDFEGEPLRPLEERRRKHAALRDVAGLLRSIDYAAVSASHVASPQREWQAAASHAFLDGYGTATVAASFLPESAAAFRDVVAVFEVEKAAYEIVYEANNRPAWIAIPQRGLTAAAARLGRSAA